MYYRILMDRVEIRYIDIDNKEQTFAVIPFFNIGPEKAEEKAKFIIEKYTPLFVKKINQYLPVLLRTNQDSIDVLNFPKA